MFNIIKKKIHIIHNIYFKHKFFIKKKSYSMDGEDIFLNDYFKDKTKGFYVDVGCYHPIHRNNTYLLHKRGWCGINIDIHQFSIDLFNYLRPKDFNCNFAVSNKNEIVEMFHQKKLFFPYFNHHPLLSIFFRTLSKLRILLKMYLLSYHNQILFVDHANTILIGSPQLVERLIIEKLFQFCMGTLVFSLLHINNN